MTQIIPTQAQDLLTLWFDTLLEKPDQQSVMKRWFSSDPNWDQQLNQQFGELLKQAEAGGLKDWEQTPESKLALIILLDQLSRNLYRGSAKAFANDPRAVKLAEQMVEQAWDQKLHPLQRLFIYLPFEHSESLAHQDQAIELFDRLKADPSEIVSEQKELFAMLLDYAHRHRDVIVKFGRFPHRNARLGRADTPEETEFLKQPGASFG